MTTAALPPSRASDRALWLAYAGLGLLCWLLYVVAGTDWQSGDWRVWTAVYDATWNIAPPLVLGAGVLPWARWLRRHAPGGAARVGAHAAAALVFAVLWHAAEFGLAWTLFGPDHARATLQQHLLWRSAWAVFLYGAIFLGFNGVLDARVARDAAVSVAQAEALLVRAELAAISGKLNPHFFFNTLNSICFLLRKDARAAEDALQRFARMMRYLLDSKRGASDRVPLYEELEFVRDYLELESLRLGARLKIEWDVDEAVREDEIPPLTLQPLVENSILHGIAPRVEGGTVRIQAQRLDEPATLVLRVSDDGQGCDWPARAAQPVQRGVGLSALRRRFEVDYDGRARLDIRSAPGAGFRVEIFIPRTELQT